MEWNLKAASWDLSEVDQTNLPNIETVDGSSRFGVYRTKGEFSVDLKLGHHVGNSGTEPVVLTNNKPKDVVTSVGSVGVSKIAAASSTPSSGSSKRARAVNNGNQTASCLVDGCNSDLSTCRDYHRRHKVCELHSKTAQVTIAGHKQRFCQQCSRFHSLEEFDEGKRSCRKRLDGHNRRRRKPQAEAITRSGSFLSNYQGTHLLPFTSSHVFPSSAMVNPGWSGGVVPSSCADIRLQQQQQLHMVEKQDLFLGSSPTSFNNTLDNFHHLHHNNTLTFTGKMFCDSSSLTSSIHDSSSSCALSLLSSPQTHNNNNNNAAASSNNNNNNNNGSLNQMVHHHHHHHSSSLMMQPLGLSLHDSSMENVDTVLGASGGGSEHCSSMMYNIESHHDGSQGNDAPQLFPFQWE